MTKKKNKTIWIPLLIGILVFSIFYFTSISKDKINNGFWNNETRECWATPNSLVGDGSVDAVSCCFNLEGRQIDCNNPSKYIGSNSLAVYGTQGGIGNPGLFSICHTLLITNDGSVPIEKAWIDSVIWSPSNSILTTAYSRILGESSTYALPIQVGKSIAFPTDIFNLQDIGGVPGSPITYDLNMQVKATAYDGELTSSKDLTGSITVEKEEIGFKVDVGWGGGFSGGIDAPLPSLVSSWNFDENSGSIAFDSVGDKDGIINGAIWTSGVEGSALYFDGVNDYVNLGDSVSSDKFTISLWIKPQPNQEYCYDGTSGNYGVAGVIDSVEGTTNWDWQLRYGSADSCSLGLQLNTVDGGKWVTIGKNLNTNIWNHIVITFSGTEEKIYVNNVLEDTNIFALTTINTNTNNKLFIGGAGWGESNTYFAGIIDEVQVYDRALSPTEISDIYSII